MTIRDGRTAECDVCGAGITVTHPAFATWETTPWSDGPATHLCPDCQDKRERGVLAEEHYLECFRCGRNTKDDPGLEWHILPDVPADPDQPRHVCHDCFRLDDRLQL